MNARGPGLAVAIAVHVALIAALLGYAPTRATPRKSEPLVVSVITPPRLAEAPPPPKPVAARIVARAVPQAPAAPISFAPITAAPVMPIEAPRTQAMLTLSTVQEPAAPAARPAPAPVTPPDYSAAYLDNPPPPYPAIAKRAGEQGKVVLRVLVTANGRADVVEVRTSSGSPRLDMAALEAVRRWRFVPARQGDEAIAAWVLVPISFTLQS